MISVHSNPESHSIVVPTKTNQNARFDSRYDIRNSHDLIPNRRLYYNTWTVRKETNAILSFLSENSVIVKNLNPQQTRIIKNTSKKTNDIGSILVR